MSLYFPNKGDLGQTHGTAMSTITCITLSEIDDARTPIFLRKISKKLQFVRRGYTRRQVGQKSALFGVVHFPIKVPSKNLQAKIDHKDHHFDTTFFTICLILFNRGYEEKKQ